MAVAAMRRLARAWDSELADRLRRSPTALAAALAVLLLIAGAALAPLLAPHDPFDLASLNLMDSFMPPPFAPPADGVAGAWRYPLGTDDQGRDILSGILFGLRISLAVGISAVLLATVTGVGAGLVAGYRGGLADAVLMRVADVQLSFPAILVALLVDGVVSALLPRAQREGFALYVIIFAIGISLWPHFARTVRGATLVERGKDYVLAARVIGLSPARIMRRHILPNVTGPILVLATLNLGMAIITEATLSFLGVGMPATQPSLGTLIRLGNAFLLSGNWWITLFPGLALVVLVMSVNLLGDWLRDALNPRLR